MVDVHDEKTRSYNMSQVRNKDTKPELIVRKFLFSKGFRYKLHDRGLPGKPDLVFPKYRCALFVNGCFWHGHDGCKYFVLPKSRTEWWFEKISKTKARDSENHAQLRELGWTLLTIFECELKSSVRQSSLDRLYMRLRNLRS